MWEQTHAIVYQSTSLPGQQCEYICTPTDFTSVANISQYVRFIEPFYASVSPLFATWARKQLQSNQVERQFHGVSTIELTISFSAMDETTFKMINQIDHKSQLKYNKLFPKTKKFQLPFHYSQSHMTPTLSKKISKTAI